MWRERAVADQGCCFIPAHIMEYQVWHGSDIPVCNESILVFCLHVVQFLDCCHKKRLSDFFPRLGIMPQNSVHVFQQGDIRHHADVYRIVNNNINKNVSVIGRQENDKNYRTEKKHKTENRREMQY